MLAVVVKMSSITFTYWDGVSPNVQNNFLASRLLSRCLAHALVWRFGTVKHHSTDPLEHGGRRMLALKLDLQSYSIRPTIRYIHPRLDSPHPQSSTTSVPPPFSQYTPHHHQVTLTLGFPSLSLRNAAWITIDQKEAIRGVYRKGPSVNIPKVFKESTGMRFTSSFLSYSTVTPFWVFVLSSNAVVCESARCGLLGANWRSCYFSLSRGS